jgi:hypothetical protein
MFRCLLPTTTRALLLAVLATGAAAAQSAAPGGGQAPAAEPRFEPLGYADLLAYERAYPLTPAHPLVVQAASRRYWVFRNVAYEGGASTGDAAWISLGPELSLAGGNENVSGRVAALAISPHCALDGPCRLWVGAAGGGVWRTDDAMHPDDPKWQWVGRGLGTNSVGALTLDPNDPAGNTIYVGTGETNTPHNSGAGTGLYRSTDGGDNWTRVPTMITDPAVAPVAIDFTFTRGISSVVIHPDNPQVMWVGTTTAMLGMTAVRGGQTQTPGFPQPRVGLYKTVNGGTSWSLVWLPPFEPVLPPNPHLAPSVGDTMRGVRDIQLDPRNPDILYVTAFNNAVHRSAPALEGGDASFKPVFAIVDGSRFRDLAMFDLTVQGGRTRMYVYNGTEETAPQALYRLDNADVPAASLVAGAGANLVNVGPWIRLSSNSSTDPGFTSRAICSSQCFYDLVVAVPDGLPDTVVVGGVQAPSFGEATIRSTDAGVNFNGFGNDAQNPRNTSHVDVRSVVFHPQNPAIAFVGSDGGVVRNDGVFVNNSGLCGAGAPPRCNVMLANVPQRIFFLNRGLQTLQFYNVALDPRDPLGRMLGGLQDNNTIWRESNDPPRFWKTLFPFGDGTSASGFHPTRADVLFASFQSDRFFTSFRNGAAGLWVRTDDPIRAAGERNTITASTGRQFITLDRINPDSQYTGFQHVWRTRNNGGDQGFLEANCRFPGGSSAVQCGDWVPLGVPYPFAPGSTPDSAGRKHGDLTSDFYGANRVGGMIVAAERTPADAGTLWAATNFGRLFVSKNADAPAANVLFWRIDNPNTPNRFVTRVFVDPGNANVAYVSYSGFNTLTPATPGHVFRVVFNPQSGQATFTPLDFDLGDLPINTIAFDHLTGDLYAGTDFGPLVLRGGTTSWALAGVGFPEALMVDLEIVPQRRILVAATHGLGIFHLPLPELPRP